MWLVAVCVSTETKNSMPQHVYSHTVPGDARWVPRLRRDELDLVIVGQLRALTLRDSLTLWGKQKATPKSLNIHQVSLWWTPGLHLHLLFLAQHRHLKFQCHQRRAGNKTGWDHASIATSHHIMSPAWMMLKRSSALSTTLQRSVPSSSQGKYPYTSVTTLLSFLYQWPRGRYESCINKQQFSNQVTMPSATPHSVSYGRSLRPTSWSPNQCRTCAGRARRIAPSWCIHTTNLWRTRQCTVMCVCMQSCIEFV